MIGSIGSTALLAALSELAREGRDVALVFAPIAERAASALAEVSECLPAARSIAIVEVGDASVASDLNRALTLNVVDYYVGHPWATGEEELYPVAGEALRVWTRDKQVQYEKVTIDDAPDGRRGLEFESWLSRNAVVTSFHTTTSPTGASLVAGPLAGVALPAVLLYNGQVLGDPADDILAEALGARTRPGNDYYDVTIVGAGPAGLAAAVYAAAEGMRTLVIEKHAIGGQAGTSTKIRNYLGFRWGISGRDLTVEASRQAEQLGAEFVVTRAATALAAHADDLLVTMTSGAVARSGSVIVTGGVAYRQLGIAAVDRLVGRGVFYGAGAPEIEAMSGRRVCVLGAGNSAGQAACALAAAGADVTCSSAATPSGRACRTTSCSR